MLAYYLTLPILYCISILPDNLLYRLSSVLHWVNTHTINYRKKVIINNLRNSFPEKTETEINALAIEFMAVLMDYIVESVKALTASKAYVLQKGEIIMDPVLETLLQEKKNIIISAGHLGSQEIMNLFIAAHPAFKYTLKATYHKLQNSHFDKLFYKNRTKFGTEMYNMKETYGAIEKQELNRPFAFVLANDQSAPPNRAYWTTFFGQDTSFYKGMAVFAQKYDMPVFYLKMARGTKRGNFILSFQQITLEPNSLSEAQILEKHKNLLEANIRADIPIWLWSHKRWKHTRPGNL